MLLPGATAEGEAGLRSQAAETVPAASPVEESEPVVREASPSPAPAVPRLRLEGLTESGSWVELRRADADGPLVFAGTIAVGTTESFPVSGRHWLRLGDTEAIAVTLGGRPRGVSGGTASFIVTTDRVTVLPEG
jgi:hypothetical protein